MRLLPSSPLEHRLTALLLVSLGLSQSHARHRTTWHLAFALCCSVSLSLSSSGILLSLTLSSSFSLSIAAAKGLSPNPFIFFALSCNFHVYPFPFVPPSVPVVLPYWGPSSVPTGWDAFHALHQHAIAAQLGPPYVYSVDLLGPQEELIETVKNAVRTPIRRL